MSKTRVAGILLTGGGSVRMGTDKATLEVEGVTLASRLGELLSAVTSPTIEVGPGRSGLPSIEEPNPGGGPLVAICVGAAALRQRGFINPVVVLACDLPLLTLPVLRVLAEWPGTGAVLPVIEGRSQPLCARWSETDLFEAARLAKSGQRSLRSLPGIDQCVRLSEKYWQPVADSTVFADVDSPGDLLRLGLQVTGGRGELARFRV